MQPYSCGRSRNSRFAKRADSAWRRSANEGKGGVLETMVKVGCKTESLVLKSWSI